MNFSMTRKKNRVFIILGLFFLIAMVASGYALVLSQNGKHDLGGRAAYVGFMILVPSALLSFIFLGLFGGMTLWINHLIKMMGTSPEGAHLKKTFSWLVFKD